MKRGTNKCDVCGMFRKWEELKSVLVFDYGAMEPGEEWVCKKCEEAKG